MPQTVTDYLASHTMLTLATASSSGRPHAAPSFYASDGTTIYFSFAPTSETARNLDENPVASIGVADVPEDWSAARGLQMTGQVSPCDEGESESAANLFLDRYPFLGDGAHTTPYIRFTPDEIHYIHNDEEADEDIEALGVHWLRETVDPDQA